jgi:dihydrofolate reductase
MERKVILYIAASLDGFIAGPDDNLDFLSIVEKPGEDYGYEDFITSIDTAIMGKRTWDWVKEHAPDYMPGFTTYVYTRSPRPTEGNHIFYTDNLCELVRKLKSGTGKNIFCIGGGMVIDILMKEKLIDEIVLSIIPVILGGGTPLFTGNGLVFNLQLMAVKNFETGLVQLSYIIKKE